MDEICVIIPIYNGEQYIDRCLKSIFEQTYKNIKVVCINDGSNDESLEILESYKKKIVLINQENQGVSAARNKGLDYVKDLKEDCLISFVDIDDYLDKNYFETLLQMLNDSNCDISCCSFVYQKKDKSKPYIQIKNDQKLSCFLATKTLIEDKTIQSHSHCKLYKNSVWTNVRFPVGIGWMEDQATIFKTFMNAKNGVFVSNYCGYHYWQEGTSACRSGITNKKILSTLYGYKVPFDNNFSEFSFDEQKLLKKSSLDAFAFTYLSVIPWINKKTLSSEEKEEFLKYKIFVETNKIIKKCTPFCKKDKYKKLAYLFFRPFYNLIYKLFA
mgnify:CR=1 FL=1